VIGLPPLAGAVQLTFAALLPGLAPTLVGAAGAVWLDEANTTVAMSQIVLAPVWTLAAGVAPAATGWSSASISMSLSGD
jgi:hypothetical protein